MFPLGALDGQPFIEPRHDYGLPDQKSIFQRVNSFQLLEGGTSFVNDDAE